MRNERRNSNPQKKQCRRDVILKQLLSLVREIEECDKQPGSDFYEQQVEKKQNPDHQAVNHDPFYDFYGNQVVKKQDYDQQAVNHDPSCHCESDDLKKDEYYQPMTLDGEPARPVLTRKAASQQPQSSRLAWIPPCFEIVPTMDYTFNCYQPPYKKHGQDNEPRPMNGQMVENVSHIQEPERHVNNFPETSHRSHEEENKNHHHEYSLNNEVMKQEGKHYTFGNEALQQKCSSCTRSSCSCAKHHNFGSEAHQHKYSNSPEYSHNNEVMRQEGKYQSFGNEAHQHNYSNSPEYSHNNEVMKQEGKHHNFGSEAHQHKYTNSHEYPHNNDVMRQEGKYQSFGNEAHQHKYSNSQQEEKNQVEKKDYCRENVQDFQRDYTCVYDPLEVSSRRVSCQEDQKPYSGRPDTYQEPPWEGGDSVRRHYPKEIERHHPEDKPLDPRRNRSEQPIFTLTQDSWKVKSKEGSKVQNEHERHRSDEPKYHPSSFPKAIVWLKPKEDVRDQVENQPRRLDESKYYPVLIPKDVVWPKQKEDHHHQNEPNRLDESKYQAVLIPKEVIHRRPIEDSRGPVENLSGRGKIHHGKPEYYSMDKRNSRNVGNGRESRDSREFFKNRSKELPKRNGLAPQAKDEEKKGPQGQSIFCFEDRVKREQKEAMNLDYYGCQNCPHVHPPEVYFTYPCPEQDRKHNHWSPPETTICRYPNICAASCFEHPVLNNWVYQQPSYKHYLQRRDYTPF